MVFVCSRRLVKLSARLRRRGVQGVEVGVERTLLMLFTQEARDGAAAITLMDKKKDVKFIPYFKCKRRSAVM